MDVFGPQGFCRVDDELAAVLTGLKDPVMKMQNLVDLWFSNLSIIRYFFFFFFFLYHNMYNNALAKHPIYNNVGL